jgi:hypothetical protein
VQPCDRDWRVRLVCGRNPTSKKLAKILFTSTRNLEKLSKNTSLYHCWDEPKKNGGVRTIEAPYDNLKIIQKRIAELLHRIEPPDFLMAPVKRRSYVHNAAIHVGARAFRLLDIENFFPSCTDKKVYWFFHKKMHCAPDVAAILTKLATFNGHLPQGSPCSPILAYNAYMDMWEEISTIIAPSNCRLSIYADDITISGTTVYERDVWAVKQALHRHGHRYSCRKERRLINKAADITGVIVSGDDLLLPNRQHKQLRSLIKQRQAGGHGKHRETLDRQLRGRMAQANQILRHPL